MPLTDLLRKTRKKINRSALSIKKSGDNVSDHGAKEPEVAVRQISVNIVIFVTPSIVLTSEHL